MIFSGRLVGWLACAVSEGKKVRLNVASEKGFS
jgi:hypothetical protein